MSFKNLKKYVEEGDTVILYINHNRMLQVDIVPKIKNKNGEEVDNIVQTIYGGLLVTKLIGQEYGAKINLLKGYVIIMQPDPNLWLNCLPHRTQILYSSYISMILLRLNIRPGSVVIESGTGSGALSHAFINGIKPNGILHTYDFHEERVNKAQLEFKKHGLSDWVNVHNADVYSNGFQYEKVADAIFLDLPCPWKAIYHVIHSLKNGGAFCSFSPCIEQVQKTCETIKKLGFHRISTIEIVQIERQVKKYIDKSLDLGCLKFEKQLDINSEKSKNLGNENEESLELEETKGDTKNSNIKNNNCKELKYTSVPFSSQKGHSGYLTFAILPFNHKIK